MLVFSLYAAAWLAAAPPVTVLARLGDDEVLTVRYCNLPEGSNLRGGAHAIAPISVAHSGIDLTSSPLGDCAYLRHDLGAITNRRVRDIGYRVGDDLFTWAWTWWRQPDTGPVDVRFKLPPGWQMSVPWPACLHDTSGLCFRLGTTPDDFPAIVSFGKFQLQKQLVGKSTVEIAVLGDLTASQRAVFGMFTSSSVALIRDGMGSFPGPRLQLQIIPIPSRQSGVHWGQVYRGGYGGVQLFVNPSSSAAELAEDWVLAHELSHLRHPYLGTQRGRWLAEGLASYYQNVLRARSGQLGERAAWQKLLAGFERGRRDAQGQTLDQVASDMDESRHYMRVYWSGAAFWLKVDLSLRRNGSDLDSALQHFAERNLPAAREWSPAEFLSAIDAQLKTAFLVKLADQAGRALEFPDVSAELAELGLIWNGRHLTLRTDPAQQALRNAIFEPLRKKQTRGTSADPG